MGTGARTTPPRSSRPLGSPWHWRGPDGSLSIDFAELALDIAIKAEQAIWLTEKIDAVEARIADLYAAADPDRVVTSAPGVGPVISAVIAGRVGDPHRFASVAAIRAYSRLVPKVNQSGVTNPTLSITKAGDPLLREALFLAADHARFVDPQLAAKYARLMTRTRHHSSAVYHIAAPLLTRIATCWRTGSAIHSSGEDGPHRGLPSRHTDPGPGWEKVLVREG